MPRDSLGRPLVSLAPIDPLDAPTRGRLALLLEQHQPLVAGAAIHSGHVADVMAHLAIERIVAARGDLTLRRAGARPFQSLVEMVLREDASLPLDAVGAWADMYARLPEIPWLRHEEGEYLAAVEAVLAGTPFGIRGREIVLREDLGEAVLIDEPLEALITTNPALRDLDAELREALDELAEGNAADAVTDGGTALQMLLDHLGYSGTQLGDQLKAARKAGWLSGVDTPLANAIESVGAWISSVRNQRSDAHPTLPPDLRDAALVVRMVGLLVLRFG